MPRRNETGPMGNGPMTGRGMGPCNQNQAFYGRGLRRGLGRGFGYYNAPMTKEDLEEEKSLLKQRLDEIEKELK
ncbi:DUF5320 domain-containing protein [Mycoplasmatota bacterium]|nr:DUF5320 domain-containing protein [Mycoplasmatota bacterium]